MTVTDDYLANNAGYAKSFQGPLPLPPSKHVAVLACMDARLDVYRALGLHRGRGARHPQRRGVVTDDAVRSLAISQACSGPTEIILIHHTDCGMLTSPTTTSSGRSRTRPGRTPWWPRPSPTSPRCPAVAAPDQEQPLRHQAHLGARVHLRRRHRRTQ